MSNCTQRRVSSDTASMFPNMETKAAIANRGLPRRQRKCYRYSLHRLLLVSALVFAALASPVRGMQAVGNFLGGAVNAVLYAPKAVMNYVLPEEKAPKLNWSVFDPDAIDFSVKAFLKPHLQYHKLLEEGFSSHWDRLLEEITSKVMKLLTTTEVGDFVTDNFAVFKQWLNRLDEDQRYILFTKLVNPAVKGEAGTLGRLAMKLAPGKIEKVMPEKLESLSDKLRRQLDPLRRPRGLDEIEVPSKDNSKIGIYRRRRRNIKKQHGPTYDYSVFDISKDQNLNNIVGNVKNLVEQFKWGFGKCMEWRKCTQDEATQAQQTNGKCRLCKDRKKAGLDGWSRRCVERCSECHAPWDGIGCIDFNKGNFLIEVLRNLLEPLVGRKRTRVHAEDCRENTCNNGRMLCPTCEGAGKICNGSKKPAHRCKLWHKCREYLIDCTKCKRARKVRCNNCHGTGKQWKIWPDGSFQTTLEKCDPILYTIRKATIDIFIEWITKLPEHGAVDLRNAVVDMIVKQMPAMGWGPWAKSWGLAAVGGFYKKEKKASMLVEGLTKEINSEIKKIVESLTTQVQELQEDCSRRRLTETGQYNNGTFTENSMSPSELCLHRRRLSHGARTSPVLAALMQEIEDSKRNYTPRHR